MAAVDRICEICHEVFHTEDEVCPRDGGALAAMNSPEDLIGRVIDGKLTLDGVLGRGGMGVVYRAHQHSVDRAVAVKVLHPSYADDAEAVRRFLHEARAASRLDHPNVITVFDFGRSEDGLLYIVMELLSGDELGKLMDGQRLPVDRSIHVLTQVCDAVHHAHERGLVHRDLKPENVFLLEGSALRRDFVKVLDFGIAMMRSFEGLERLTQTGAVCGTPGYMSPEQILGDTIDRRSDVYALGVVAYEMLAGRHPFPADTPMRQLLAHLEQPPPSFAAAGADGSVPAAVEAVVMRALAKSREARFDTALDFAEALVAAHAGRSLAGLGGTNPVVASATSPGAPRSTQETTDRRRQATSAAARTGQRRALADTMIAVDQVDLADVPAPRRDLRRAAPYAVLAAVVVAAIALFLAKGGSPTEESRAATPNAVARIAETTPAPGAAMTPAPTGATAAKPAAETAAAPARVETPREEPVAAEVAAAPPVAKPVPVDAIGRDHLIAAKAAALEARRSAKIPITSTPPGAIVRVEGTELGTTPLEVPRPPDGQVWQVTLTKADYQVSFAALSDAVDEVHVAMRKRAVAAPSRTGGATAAPSGGAGEKTDEKFDFNVPIAP